MPWHDSVRGARHLGGDVARMSRHQVKGATVGGRVLVDSRHAPAYHGGYNLLVSPQSPTKRLIRMDRVGETGCQPFLRSEALKTVETTTQSHQSLLGRPVPSGAPLKILKHSDAQTDVPCCYSVTVLTEPSFIVWHQCDSITSFMTSKSTA